MKFTTEEELAAEFKLPLDKVADMRQRQKWPHIRLTRFDVRYTDEQIEQIVALKSFVPEKSTAGESGLTDRSAARAGR